VKFTRADVSKLTSQRASVDRRYSKAEWRLNNDPFANTVHLSEMMERFAERSAELTAAIAVEVAVDERKALRQALLANCR
jgi:hypothetical protein